MSKNSKLIRVLDSVVICALSCDIDKHATLGLMLQEGQDLWMLLLPVKGTIYVQFSSQFNGMLNLKSYKEEDACETSAKIPGRLLRKLHRMFTKDSSQHKHTHICAVVILRLLSKIIRECVWKVTVFFALSVSCTSVKR